MRLRVSLIAATLAVGVWLATPAWAGPFFFTTGNPDGLLGALSRRPSLGKIETETADDFVLAQTTVITGVTITGLIPSGAPLTNINNVEVELYHIFPLDSDTGRTPSVPSRVNSPSDLEIGAATRDGSSGTLSFTARSLNGNFSVANTVVNGINKAPINFTGGEGPATGEEVEITITFTSPILLSAAHYFFRPEVLVTGGDFLYLSAPKPVSPPLFTGDLQAWIRNSNLAPDWLRIGTDITHSGPFNMTFSLTGNTIPEAGTPGQANCHGQTVSAMANEFGGIDASASTLGYSSVDALQDGIRIFCGR